MRQHSYNFVYIMLSAEFPYNNEQFPEDGEFIVPEELNQVLEEQFELAQRLEWIEDAKGPHASKGRYYKHVVLPVGPDQTRHSLRIVMKQPHPEDVPGTFWEIFKLMPKLGDEMEELPQQYVLRNYTEGRPGPFWITGEDNAIFRLAEAADDFALHVPSDPLRPYEQASELASLLADQNIVASVE